MTKAEIIKRCNEKKKVLRNNRMWTALAGVIALAILMVCMFETLTTVAITAKFTVWLLGIILFIIIYTGTHDSNRRDIDVADKYIASGIAMYIEGTINKVGCLKPDIIETCVIDKKDSLMITLMLKFKTDDFEAQKNTLKLVNNELSKMQQEIRKVMNHELYCITAKYT